MEYLVIDVDKRQINIPESIEHLGVKDDNETRTLNFRMPKIYKGLDMSDYTIEINYINAKGKADSALTGNIQVGDEEITFQWCAGGTVYAKDGKVRFLVYTYLENEDGIRTNEWHTTWAELKVLEGGNVNEQIAEESPRIIEEMLRRINALENGEGIISDDVVAQAIESYLIENPIEGGEVTDEQVAQAVEEYLVENPVKGEVGPQGPAGTNGTSVTVVDVTESTEDGGSNIVTFSNGKQITIRNGSKGSQGEKGETGEQGIQGIQGEKGETGAQGPKGDKGDKGDTGTTGPQGQAGSDASVTSENIKEALGYTPANETKVSQLEEEIADLGGVTDYVVTEAESVLGRVLEAQGARTFNGIVMTDLHNNGGVSDVQIMHACQGASYIAERIKIDAFACLNDNTDNVASSNWSDGKADITANNKYKSLVKADRLELMGNHDFKSAKSPLTHKLISAFSKDVIWGDMLGGYFHKDYEDYKLRIIGVNTSESAHIGISADQYNWFIYALDLSEKENASEWQILLLSHVPLDWEGLLFPYILKAYVNGTSWTDGTYSCDYTDKNQSIIIGNVHGHIHNLLVSRMYIGGTTNGEQINVWRFAIPEVTELYQNHYSAPFVCDTTYPKTADTSEDTSFNVLCIDLDSKKINAICYGAGIDRTIEYTVFDEESGGDDSGESSTNTYQVDIASIGYTDDARWSMGDGTIRTGATGMTAINMIPLEIASGKTATIELSGINFASAPNSGIALYSGDTLITNGCIYLYNDFDYVDSLGVSNTITDGKNIVVVTGIYGDSIDGFKVCGYGSGAEAKITITIE